MANVVDNLIAFRILYLLVTPFEKTEAFRLGVIDKDGQLLIKIKDQTLEQKQAYDMLDRLVFNLKRLLGKVPGGKSQLASLAAAYFLVKESYETRTNPTRARVERVMSMSDDIVLAEELITIEDFLTIYEEMGASSIGSAVGKIANVTGSATSTDIPVIRVGKKKKPTSIARRITSVELR